MESDERRATSHLGLAFDGGRSPVDANAFPSSFMSLGSSGRHAALNGLLSYKTLWQRLGRADLGARQPLGVASGSARAGRAATTARLKRTRWSRISRRPVPSSAAATYRTAARTAGIALAGASRIADQLEEAQIGLRVTHAGQRLESEANPVGQPAGACTLVDAARSQLDTRHH